MYAKGDFCNYLLSFKVEKGCEFTHTSIVKPSGAFYIPGEEEDQFFDRYKTAMAAGEELYVTEKHKAVGPVVIDFDFRFEKEESIERRYSADTVKAIMGVYTDVFSKYFSLKDGEGVEAYVMEKPHPVVDKGVLKDGLHIVVPGLVSKPSVQFLIRDEVIKALKGNGALDGLRLKNGLEDVVDEAVISRNNWQMYGSKKPNCEAYRVTRVYRLGAGDGEGKWTMEEVGLMEKNEDYVERCSIRNKYVETGLKIEVADKVAKYEEKQKLQHKKMADARLAKVNTKKNVCDNMDLVCKLVDILSPSRADKYDDWIRLGWCLRNIDFRLLEKWDDFSRKSSKYAEGECEKIWNLMRDDGLGVGTLHMWAKLDSPEEYKKLMERDLANLIYRSRTETHHDIAKVLHFLYKYDYVCVSIKHNAWYEFKNHRWVNCDCGHTLRARISTDLVREYCAAAAYYNAKASQEEMEADQNRYLEDAKKLNGIALKLKQSPFKDNIIKECRELFYLEKFEEKLDSRCHLIGFENGVYDLDADEFREGRPEDYVSFSTGNNYIDYDADHPYMKDVQGFLGKVFTKEVIRNYVMKVLASFLNGNIKEERFHIWTGVGCFAKSTQIMMYDGSSKSVEDVVVGDLLMGDDSTPRTVQDLKRGYSDMYEIVPSKGEKFVVNGMHDLVLKAKQPIVMDMNKQRACCIRWLERTNMALPVLKACIFESSDPALVAEKWTSVKDDPNVVLTDEILHITVHDYLALDDDVREGLFMYRPSSPVEFPGATTPSNAYYMGRDCSVLDSIPMEYKTATKVARDKLLRGFLDAHGFVNRITVQSEALVDDLVFVARSLGLWAYKQPSYSAGSGWVFCLDGLSEPFSFKVNRVEDGDFYGFGLDGNRRFLLGGGDFTVSKNSNGKSKIIELFESAFGEYCCKFPITLLTQKRAASNATTSEVARAKGKRFACLQEPSEDEKLNIGLMKELTGGDKIMARALFKEPIEFKPQFKMILTCNHLPNVPSDDGGTWRRIRVVEFTSRFKECPDPTNPDEFLADTELSQKFGDWKEHFMSLLVRYYRKYREEGMFEPEDVLKCTKEYQRTNDNFLEFIEQEVEKDERGFLSASDMFAKFTYWCKENAPHFKVSTKKNFTTAIEKNLGKMIHAHKVQGWKGYRFKQDALMDDDPLGN